MPKVNLGRIRTVFKGEWVPGTYVIDDVVLYAGSSYTCIAPATLSNNPTDTTFWVQSAGGIEFTGTWDTAVTYKTNQIVTFNQQTYIAITAHSGTEPTTTGQTDWSVMAGGFKFEGAWNVATAYQINDIVVFEGSTYIATSNQTGTQPEAVGNASWSLFAAKGDSFADQAGQAGKVLKTDGTDTSWTNVGIPELGIADGDEEGWLLSTDGAGSLSFVAPPITSAGGGTPYDSDHTGNWIAGETWDDHDTYGRVHQYTKGQFAWQHQTFDDQNTMRVRLRVMPFQVDQTTGIITRGTAGYGFQNNGGYAHSTSSFGFCGNIGMSWGNTPWGSNTSHYAGGCTWRVNDNNTVTQGDNTGNSSYASENTSNGMLALYQYGNNTYWNIPNGSYTSLGYCTTSNANVQDWSSSNEHGGNYSTTYIWRCIGNTVGINHAGVVSDNQGVRAMNATGSNGYTGNYMPLLDKNDRDGIGFELDNGRQIYMDRYANNIGVRNSYNDGLNAGILTVTGTSNAIFWSSGLGQSLSYNTTGTPAVEADTFYFTTNENILLKFRFENTSGYNYNMVILGSIDLDVYGQTNFYSYTRWSGITGDNDKFLVLSYQQTSYKPHNTYVLDNPLMDA